MQSANLNKQIIHVDDDPDMLHLVKHYLSPSYDVISINDPTECVNELVRSGSRLVILDIEMGEHNGLDLLRTIKRLDGGIHVIMLTGLVSMETILTSMRDGAEACLFKPLEDKNELLEVIDDSMTKIARWHMSVRNLLDRRRASSQAKQPVLS